LLFEGQAGGPGGSGCCASEIKGMLIRKSNISNLVILFILGRIVFSLGDAILNHPFDGRF
jgi:hypothetical protein